MTEIVTWNVQRSRPPEEVKDDIVLLQESFQRSIICLQEMPIGDQVSLFGSNRLERDKENVIIYPAWYELKNTSVIPAQTKTRSFLHCILQQGSALPFSVLTGKLRHGLGGFHPLGSPERAGVLRQLLQMDPDIVALDTNACLPGELARLRSDASRLGFDSPGNHGATFFPDLLETNSLAKRLLSKFGTPQELDTFFVRRKTRRIVSSRVLDDSYCSDHQPVVAKLSREQ